MSYVQPAVPLDTSETRKARGAFFTPPQIVDFVVEWAIRHPTDRVLEPSAGEAEFLVAAARRFKSLRSDNDTRPVIHGIEIHEESARRGRERVAAEGGEATIRTADFFEVEVDPSYTAVVGNPPYIRYQGWTGEARTRSRAAALRGGVSLSGLASSWAAFTIQSSLHLATGGRLGLVLPAELLSVNYAAPVRKFLFDRFRNVELVMFDEQVFPGVEADVVLLLAEGFNEGPAQHATIRMSRDARSLAVLGEGKRWTPSDPAAKWSALTLHSSSARRVLDDAKASGRMSPLKSWGETSLGIVTGSNKFFTLSPKRATDLQIPQDELLLLSPAGSNHLRGLSLTHKMLESLGRDGASTALFYPREDPSPAAQRYIEIGHDAGVDLAYKCRVRRSWWRVPLVPVADLFLTAMNADAPRITTNTARAHHLNSVYGISLSGGVRKLGLQFLPLASINSLTLLHAELIGRSYGGGILKVEPREADAWLMPSPALVAQQQARLAEVRQRVLRLLKLGRLTEAAGIVDRLLFDDVLSGEALKSVREAREHLANRRRWRGSSATS